MSENENESRETVADIVAEMRDHVVSAKAWKAGIKPGVVMDFADRVETAARRDEERAIEHATRHAEAVARDNCRDCVHNPSGKNYEGGNGGNAAAVREALLTLRDAARMFCHQVLNSKYNDIMDTYKCRERGFPALLDLRYAIPKANFALAAPPRNCDRFQVAAEALQEWQSLVKAKPNTWDFRYNYWLFAPAERKGDGDESK